MYGSWKTDISGTSVDSGAVVIGPKSTAPSWICWATSRSPATAVARIAIESARAVMGGPPVLAVPVRRLPDGFPEARVVTGEDRAAGQSRDRLQLLDRVERLRRVPDDPGHALLFAVLPPV